jgi:hypothetical protein
MSARLPRGCGLAFSPAMPIATAAAILRIEALAVETGAKEFGVGRIGEAEHHIADAVMADAVSATPSSDHVRHGLLTLQLTKILRAFLELFVCLCPLVTATIRRQC